MNPRIGLLGCSGWGGRLIRTFYRLGALKAVCDGDPARLHEQVTRYQGIELVTNPRTLLSDPEIDAVAIATPVESHYDMAVRALLAGKDVLMEQPLALTLQEGRRLVELAEVSGRLLMVGNLLESQSAALKLIELVNRGELGEIQYLYCNRLNSGREQRNENNFRSFAADDISALLRLTGESPFEVTACGGQALSNEAPTVTLTNLLFPSGAQAHIFASRLHPYKEHKLVAIGSRKIAVFDDLLAEGKLRLFDKGIEWINGEPRPRQACAENELIFPERDPLENESIHFLECIETREEPRSDGFSALRVLAVLEACEESMRSRGAPVEVRSPVVAPLIADSHEIGELAQTLAGANA